jgi:hypothetical protein
MSEKPEGAMKNGQSRETVNTGHIFGGVHVVRLFRFMCCVFVVVCLHPVSYVPGIDGFSRLSMYDSVSTSYLTTR